MTDDTLRLMRKPRHYIFFKSLFYTIVIHLVRIFLSRNRNCSMKCQISQILEPPGESLRNRSIGSLSFGGPRNFDIGRSSLKY